VLDVGWFSGVSRSADIHLSIAHGEQGAKKSSQNQRHFFARPGLARSIENCPIWNNRLGQMKFRATRYTKMPNPLRRCGLLNI
jgi:hypothetical protein